MPNLPLTIHSLSSCVSASACKHKACTHKPLPQITEASTRFSCSPTDAQPISQASRQIRQFKSISCSGRVQMTRLRPLPLHTHLPVLQASHHICLEGAQSQQGCGAES